MADAFTVKYTGYSDQLRSTVYVRAYGDAGNTKDRVAVWDTGAMKTTISKELAKELKLNVVSYINVSTPNGKGVAASYYVDVLLPNSVIVQKVLVLEGTLEGFDVLVGMDIIGLGDFAVSNFNGSTMFSYRYPSMMDIDFVKNTYLQPTVITGKQPGRNSSCPCNSGKKYKNCCGKT